MQPILQTGSTYLYGFLHMHFTDHIMHTLGLHLELLQGKLGNCKTICKPLKSGYRVGNLVGILSAECPACSLRKLTKGLKGTLFYY